MRPSLLAIAVSGSFSPRPVSTQTTCSAHYIANPSLRRAIADYLKHERAYVQDSVHELTEAGPFRKAGLND